MACIAYLKDVRNLLGNNLVNTMINFSKTERFPSEKLSPFALHLSGHKENSSIHGNHLRRKKEGEDGLKAILCDWWAEELCELPIGDAYEKLLSALESPDVNAKALAARINDIIRESEQGKTGTKENSLPTDSGWKA